jgi:hypothetical protein
LSHDRQVLLAIATFGLDTPSVPDRPIASSREVSMSVAEPAKDANTSRAVLRGWVAASMAFVIVFGVLAIEHAAALGSGRIDLATRLLAWMTSDSFVFGAGSLRYTLASYEAASWRMPVHMALGGAAVALGSLQFVPALRRSHPRLHRLNGLVVWLAAFMSMVGAVAYLWFVPMREGASGPAFQLGLWALSLLTLALLWQALVAVWARDFRSHMVWMSLLFAALATAPMLRLDWIVFAAVWPARGHEMVNLATGMFVLTQTVVLMCLWLSWVGDRDLPGRKESRSAWPAWLVVGLAALSAVGALQEGILVRAGFDLFASARTAQDVMPPVAGLLWAAATVAAMVLLPREWVRGLSGERPTRLFSTVAAFVATAALLVGIQYDTADLARFGTAVFWVAYGLLILTGLALAHVIVPNSVGRNAWSMFTLAALWLPSQIGVLLFFNLRVGAGFSEAMTAALVNGIGGLIVVGAAVGFGARLRLVPQARRGATPLVEPSAIGR